MLELDIEKRSAWGSPAGKASIATKIAAMIPRHRVYVEPFAGAGSVLFAKEAAAVEVVGDADPEVAEAWRILKRTNATLLAELRRRRWIGDAQLFKRLTKSKPMTDAGRLHRFVYLSLYSYGYGRRSFNPRMQGLNMNCLRRIEKAAPRARRLHVHEGDYAELLAKYDGPDTFFFLDPPYAGHKAGGRGVGESRFSDERFFEALRKIKGKWLLTCGARGTLHKLAGEAGFKVRSFDMARRTHTMRGSSSDATLRQYLATNYDPPEAEPTRKRWRVARVGEEIAKRLAAREVAGLLSLSELDAGSRVALVDGAGLAHGIAEVKAGVEFPSGPVAVAKLGAKIGEASARAAGEAEGPVWFHSLALVEQWTPPRGVATSHAHRLLGVAKRLLEELEKRGEESKQLRPLWGSPGGKSRMAKQIADMLPEHRAYVEPFAGSAAVFWAKAPAEKSAIGDGDPEIAKAFSDLAGLTDAEIAKLEAADWRSSPKSYHAIKASAPSDRVGRLHRHLYLSRFSFLGTRTSYDKSTDGATSQVARRLRQARDRLRGVDVHAGDYRELVKRHDGPDTVFFFDPPYPGSYGLERTAREKKTGTGETDFDEAAFFETLKSIKGKWLLTYGTGGKLPAMLRKAGYRVRRVKTRASARTRRATAGEGETLTHLVFSNFGQGISKAAGPMRAAKSYTDKREAVEAFATPERLEAGVVVEPNYRGDVVVVRRGASGPPTVWVDGEKAEGELVKAAEAVPPSTVLVGVQAAADGKVYVWDLLAVGGKDLAREPWGVRKSARDESMGGRGWGEFVNAPSRVARSRDRVTEAVTWAEKQPGSRGAVLKVATDPHTPGASSSVAALASSRIVNALVVAAKGEGDRLAYDCALEVPAAEREEWRDVLELDEGLFVKCGTTSPTTIKAERGEVLRVEIAGLSVVDTPGARGITWQAPIVAERVKIRPDGVAAVRAKARPDEVRKSLATVAIIDKRDDEQFVLGVVLEPNDGKDGAALKPDAHQDIYSAEDIRDAAHLFMSERGGKLGIMHEREASKSQLVVVESYIAPVGFELGGQRIAKGSWLLGAHVPDAELWGQIKAGKYNAWSIQGKAMGRPEEVKA